MNRIAGMVISEGRAYLVVLASDRPLETDIEGKPWAWRVESARTKPIDDLDLDPPLDCPIVLDAAAWEPVRVAAFGIEVSQAEGLRAAGWDVRPPAWKDGKACNPSDLDLRGDEFARDLTTRDVARLAFGHDATVRRAFHLAAWGATHATAAEPPRVPTAPRSSDVDARPLKTAMIAAAYGVEVVDVLPVTTGGTAPNPWAQRDEARAERDEAERLLATMVATWDGESMRDDQAARDAASRYLVARGLLTEGK